MAEMDQKCRLGTNEFYATNKKSECYSCFSNGPKYRLRGRICRKMPIPRYAPSHTPLLRPWFNEIFHSIYRLKVDKRFFEKFPEPTGSWKSKILEYVHQTCWWNCPSKNSNLTKLPREHRRWKRSQIFDKMQRGSGSFTRNGLRFENASAEGRVDRRCTAASVPCIPTWIFRISVERIWRESGDRWGRGKGERALIFFVFEATTESRRDAMSPPYMEPTGTERYCNRDVTYDCSQKMSTAATSTDGFPCKEGYIFGYSCTTSKIKSALDTAFTSIVARSSAQTEICSVLSKVSFLNSEQASSVLWLILL